MLIKYDIKDFYSSITEKCLLEPLLFAKDFVCLKPKQIKVILHCRKSVLFHGGKSWIKKSKPGRFDVPKGSYEGQSSELMGMYILSKVNKIDHIDDHGIYRDDGPMVVTMIIK